MDSYILRHQSLQRSASEHVCEQSVSLKIRRLSTGSAGYKEDRLRFREQYEIPFLDVISKCGNLVPSVPSGKLLIRTDTVCTGSALGQAAAGRVCPFSSRIEGGVTPHYGFIEKSGRLKGRDDSKVDGGSLTHGYLLYKISFLQIYMNTDTFHETLRN